MQVVELFGNILVREIHGGEARGVLACDQLDGCLREGREHIFRRELSKSRSASRL